MQQKTHQPLKKVKKEITVKDLIGRNWEQARQECLANGYWFRVLRKDDKQYMVTHDLVKHRFNVDVENNIITKVTIG